MSEPCSFAQFRSQAMRQARLDPDLRDDVEKRRVLRPITNVMPAKAGTHASLRACDVQELRNRGEEVS
jgi:hypothetical protein